MKLIKIAGWKLIDILEKHLEIQEVKSNGKKSNNVNFKFMLMPKEIAWFLGILLH